MDKEWTKYARESKEYQNGVEFFLDYAYTKGKSRGKEISCPCAECYNTNWFTRKDQIDELLFERFRDVIQEEFEFNDGLNEDAKMFYNLVEEAKQELYPGCKNFSKLSFTIQLYLLKCLYGWSYESFNALLELLKEAMPSLNIPNTFNKTKGMIKDLGLDYKKINACPNDYMIYWKNYENETSCHVCGAPRWKEISKGNHQTASSLRWHEEERSKDGKLRHPTDGEAWKEFDKCHPDFALDSRNIRLGLSNDEFNPFRTMNKVIEVADLDILQTEIVETLCQLETIFPPSFFDIMVHLPIHLVNEVRLGGPVQFRWMYFTERYLGKMKSYVCNKSRPKGSIAEGYLVEECLTFCSRYLHSGVETSEHENEDVNVNKRKRWSKAKSQGLDFVEWFKKRALLSDVSDKLKKLSRGPNKIARHFSSYLINGYRFHTKQRDARRKTQNIGVTLMAVTESFASTKDENPIIQSITFYGSITEIVEVDYYGMLKFVLFRCDWFEVEEDKYGLTCVYFNKRCYMDHPFVLASQVHQCLYIQDPFNPNRHYVMKSIPREFFNLNKQSNSNGQQPYQCDPFDNPVNLAASDETCEVEFVRNDIPPTIIVNSLCGSDEKESDDDSSFDETLLD
ncbi:uncharacterized protein [Cicer arietinum]|uniref:uncharacterized protein n=1 Tax=Cicer arietinum TaxID=3827 RepID=UPI003CC6CF4F